jgi:phenylacetate-CoA ligase
MLEIRVEVLEKMFSDRIKRLEELEDTIRTRVESVLGINAKIRLVEPRSIPRSEGKAVRVIDKRQI